MEAQEGRDEVKPIGQPRPRRKSTSWWYEQLKAGGGGICVCDDCCKAIPLRREIREKCTKNVRSHMNGTGKYKWND